MIRSLEHTPQIIAITGVNNKSNNTSVSSDFIIPSYEVYNTNLEELCRGVITYVIANLQSSITFSDSPYKELFIVTVKGDIIENLTICTVFCGPNSSPDDGNFLIPYINQDCDEFTGSVIIVGDFNVSD